MANISLNVSQSFELSLLKVFYLDMYPILIGLFVAFIL